ncbi:MAG: hypothetical protein ACLQBD_14670 [Syntrophobacteraceae bacterium]
MNIIWGGARRVNQLFLGPIGHYGPVIYGCEAVGKKGSIAPKVRAGAAARPDTDPDTKLHSR